MHVPATLMLVAPFIRPTNKVGDTPPALLPLLPHRNCGHALRGSILGGLEAGAAPYIQVPPRADEGDSRGRNSSHCGE